MELSRISPVRVGLLMLVAALLTLAGGASRLARSRILEHGRIPYAAIRARAEQLSRSLAPGSILQIDTTPITLLRADGSDGSYWMFQLESIEGRYQGCITLDADSGEVCFASRTNPFKLTKPLQSPRERGMAAVSWLRRLDVLRPEEDCKLTRIQRCDPSGWLIQWRSARRDGSVFFYSDSDDLASVTSRPLANAPCGEGCI